MRDQEEQRKVNGFRAYLRKASSCHGLSLKRHRGLVVIRQAVILFFEEGFCAQQSVTSEKDPL
jgi:hypothetical protein